MGQRIIRISDPFLAQMLHLPDGTRITGISHDLYFNTGEIAFRIEHESLSEIPDGHQILTIYPVISSSRSECGHYTAEVKWWDSPDGKAVTSFDIHHIKPEFAEQETNADEPVSRPRGREFI